MTTFSVAGPGPVDDTIIQTLENFVRTLDHPSGEVFVDRLPLQRWVLRLRSDHTGVLGVWKGKGVDAPFLHIRTGKRSRQPLTETQIRELQSSLQGATGLRVETDEDEPD